MAGEGARTRPFCALDHAFVVDVEGCARGLTRYIERLFAGFPRPHADEPPHVIAIRRRGRRWTLSFEGGEPLETTAAATVLHLLMWHLNRRAVASVTDELLFHAAAVVPPGGTGAILLAAPSESGKTSTAALVLRAGWRYLTDEAASVATDTLLCRPYAKPLSLGVGAQPAFEDLRPRLPKSLVAYGTGEWLVPATEIPESGIATTSAVAAVVSPKYVPGASSTLRPLSRSEAVRVLVENSFNFRERGTEWLAPVAALVRGAATAALVVGDDGLAPDLLAELVR